MTYNVSSGTLNPTHSLTLVVRFCQASDVHWLVFVPFRSNQYDCCWPVYQPVGIMCLKILAGFAAFMVQRVNSVVLRFILVNMLP